MGPVPSGNGLLPQRLDVNMSDEKTYTVEQAHYYFALDFHQKTWYLLEAKDRAPADDVRMLDYAHASLAHWRSTGTSVRLKRGEWLISHAYAVIGDGVQALKHARLCYELFESNKPEMEDIDAAFVYEAIARASAVQGEKANALKFIELAKKAGDAILEEEDRDAFFAEFNSGEWYGLK